MLISGIQPFTMLDYPDKTACIIFTPGCNFRCGYCHNPEFVLPEKIIKLKDSFIPEESFFSFLAKRRGLLDGVVISGGEPTLAFDLLGFMGRIKALGFLVKLDTNGNRPDLLEQAVSDGLVDYIAMDVKTSLAAYRALVGPLARPDNIKRSIEITKRSGIDYEFRTTLIKEAHSGIILTDLIELVAGAKRWYLQTFRPEHTLRPEFVSYHPFLPEDIEIIIEQACGKVGEVTTR
ncbi:MAG: anaerobic ribonucleoside-triphosphate reductase activating protein [Candidatus Magasanikbacteria bacterium RIFCSPHIGHO2_01_FULL_47_8]|uniref:Anaerobic ribonucleoside-triphosphate reductase activating protein n=1 Tax=Candidatus Magasanikbacteria bacterium RIFCSPHIGHO2_01_FULL_47_8 TaxID=1798673 RepID=A0A1F6MEE7_9BACT|nr:MAG: anaerobic ribonucleoside-triphosphate reductase activating protein [Candidatus Magasanikbacteria bacterium RIFCSPHIGHO2_01_FULL_47_8]